MAGKALIVILSRMPCNFIKAIGFVVLTYLLKGTYVISGEHNKPQSENAKMLIIILFMREYGDATVGENLGSKDFFFG